MFEKKGDLFGVHQKAQQDFFSIDEYLGRGSISKFLFKMQGDALSPYITNGDLLMIDRSLEPESGDYILASVNEVFMCRRFHKSDKGSPPSLIGREGKILINGLDQFVLFGVVSSIVRKFK